MNVQECAKVLAKIQLIDNRQVDEMTLAEWFDVIGHLKFEDATGAVTLHRKESTDWIQPAHVVRNSARVREERASDARFARAHGLLPDGWVMGDPMPNEIREQLHEARERSRRAMVEAGYNYGY